MRLYIWNVHKAISQIIIFAYQKNVGTLVDSSLGVCAHVQHNKNLRMGRCFLYIVNRHHLHTHTPTQHIDWLQRFILVLTYRLLFVIEFSIFH